MINRKNDQIYIYSAKSDVEVSYVTHWKLPFTGGGSGKINKGTKIRILESDLNKDYIYCLPMKEKVIEKNLIPKKDRISTKYDGYHLLMKSQQIKDNFELVKIKTNKMSLISAIFLKLKKAGYNTV